jgi:hypothetical protein
MNYKSKAFKKTLVAHALTLAFGVGVISVGMSPTAFAQSNAAGTIYGSVANPAGATVVLHNIDTGLKRNVAIDSTGRYTVTALPTGHYKIDLVRDGKVVATQEADVVIGQGVDVSFLPASVQQVTVSGTRSRIDISNTNNGAVFTAKELGKLPVGTNISAIILLAPNTTAGDAAYGNAVSFGGSGVSENAYYVNGFPVTNPLTQTGSSELPFGAIAQASVITGGFGAEFGRSIGGVLSITTKSGTNKWETGVAASITPNSTRSSSSNIYFPVTGNPDNASTDGKLHFKRDNNTRKAVYTGAYVGGPLIEDKLFMFVAADKTVTDTGVSSAQQSATLGRDGWTTTNKDNVRYLAKFDWNLNDDHRLEWTSIGDNTTDKVATYGYVNQQSNGVKYSEYSAKNARAAGMASNALKYTGQLTDNLVLSSVFGIGTTPRATSYQDYDVKAPLFSITDNASTRAYVPELLALYKNQQKFGVLRNIAAPGEDKVTSFRLDLEYKFGTQHTVRAGLDHNEIESKNAGVFRVGGGTWTYRNVPTGKENVPVNLSGSRPGIVGNFGGYGPRGFYVRNTLFTSVADASATQDALYIEDRFQATKNLLIVAGLRDEGYTNSDGDQRKFIEMKNQIAPRLSASWDVNGDSQTKVFGSAGRYYLQLPSQVAARAASRSTLTNQDFTYTGVGIHGEPLGLNPINTPYSPDGEYGTQKNVLSVVAKGLKPNYQDELTLGFEKAFTPDLNFGAKATYRKLGAGIDDNCDTRPMMDYSAAHNIPQSGRDNIPCYIFNPGSDATVWIDGHDQFGHVIDGKGQFATISAATLGFPKATRTYKALDFFAEHPFRNSWYGKLNYTWSRSYGNMEGQTRSDTGQLDVGVTAAWDFPEFMKGATGLLPNDRTHQIKAFGYYEITPELSVGGNLLVQSGRPKVCLGTNFDAEAGAETTARPWGAGSGYGAEYFHCGGKDVPRGSIGRLPFEKRLDLQVAYKPSVLNGVQFKIDLFNATNTQTVTARQETYDNTGSVDDLTSNYNEPRTLAASRSMKFSVEYHHKF